MGGCFVPNCDSGQRKSNNFHLFRPSPAIFPEWRRILNKIRSDTQFSFTNKNHRVCSLHFADKWIMKDFVHIVNGATVRIPRDRWKLNELAIPTIFPSLPKHICVGTPAPRRPLVRLENNSTIKKAPFSKLKAELETKPTAQQSAIQSVEQTLNVWMESLTFQNQWKINKTDSSISIYTIMEGDQNLQINRSVVVHISNEFVTWSFLIRGVDVSPQVGFNNKLEEFSTAMSRFMDLRMCEGVRGFCQVLHCKTGTYTDGIWRSRSCDVIGSARMCLPCKKLHFLLNKKLLKSPISKKRKNAASVNGKYYKAKATKLSIECRALRRDMVGIKKSLRELDLNEIKQKLEALSLPVTTQSAVIHALQTAQVKSSKGMRYSTDWLLECVIMKMKSPACYKHLRDSKILPFPHPGTLSKLISGQKCEFGFNKTSMAAIQTYFHGKLIRDRQGILMFDEVQLRETLEYNTTNHRFDGYVDFGDLSDDVVGDGCTALANHALVLMYRPFNDNWVQPIAAFATRNAAKGKDLQKVVLSAILKLEDIGAHVLAIVCDGAKPNRAFWKLFGVGRFGRDVINKVPHPCDDSRMLYFTSDVPHLFKCMRNHILKYAFVDFFGKEVDFTYYEKLLKEDSKRLFGLRKCPKLTASHIKPNCFEKMVVSLATQLFSRSVATGLHFYRELGHPEFLVSESTEEFTEFMNGLFDALNARFPSQGLTLNCKYMTIMRSFLENLRNHNETYKERNIKDVGFASPETLLGFEITVASTVEIVEYLINDLGYAFVLTGKITQDCLERFFGLVRAAGGREDHPTVTNFVQLFRLLSLYTPIKKVLRGNIRTDEEIRMLVDFKESFRCLAKENMESRAKMSNMVDDVIVEKLLEAESTNVEIVYDFDDEDNIGIFDRNIVYHLSGFLCHKAKKIFKCADCVSSLLSATPEVDTRESTLTDIMNYGGLNHPSKAFFCLILKLEKSVCNAISNYNNTGDIMLDCIRDVNFNSKDNLGCNMDGHLEILMMTLVPYYITMRLHFFTRCMRNKMGHGKATRNKRKESKLCS